MRGQPTWLGMLCFLAILDGCGSSSSPTGTAGPTNPAGQTSAAGAPTPVPQQMGSVTVSPVQAALTGAQTMRFGAVAPGTVVWSVNGVAGGNASVGTIDGTGEYLAPAVAQSTNVVVRASLGSAPSANFGEAVVALIQPTQVAVSGNPQVALYSLNLPQAGSAVVRFGLTTSYGMQTAAQATPLPQTSGGAVTIDVAGMRASTTYHLQAQVTFANGATFSDADHAFTTGAALPTPPIEVSMPAGSAPQSGVELFDAVEFGSSHYDPTLAQAFATDLQGNVVWTYRYSGTPANVITPIKLLPSGHLMLNITVTTAPTGPAIPAGTLNEIREIDLAGNTIRTLTIAALNQSLAAGGFAGLDLFAFSHDLLALPNGHFVFLASMARQVSGVGGYSGPVNVAGDVVVDTDPNFKPDWVWNTFDHLDVNRHPFQFPDWTHSDALLYSPDDGALLLSIRNQNWIVKIDFQDGSGSGNVLWRLGEGGDFTLAGGVDPTDWFYAQHGMNFFGTSTSGIFQLGVLDDGDDRVFPAGVSCGSSGAPPCTYSTVPVLEIDESARTATLVHHYFPPASLYSFFGGQADLLPDGHIEADFCAAKAGATVQEYEVGAEAVESAPPIVWQAFAPGLDLYRSVRLPSLYPGVQW